MKNSLQLLSFSCFSQLLLSWGEKLFLPIPFVRSIRPQLIAGSEEIAIVGVNLIDGRRDVPLENATVLVSNGRIKAAGPRSEIDSPQWRKGD